MTRGLGGETWQSDLASQSNERDGVDSPSLAGSERRFRSTKSDGQDEPDGPLEPVAQVRVLPTDCFSTAQRYSG
jgi:hypothetical protein